MEYILIEIFLGYLGAGILSLVLIDKLKNKINIESYDSILYWFKKIYFLPYCLLLAFDYYDTDKYLKEEEQTKDSNNLSDLVNKAQQEAEIIRNKKKRKKSSKIDYSQFIEATFDDPINQFLDDFQDNIKKYIYFTCKSNELHHRYWDDGTIIFIEDTKQILFYKAGVYYDVSDDEYLRSQIGLDDSDYFRLIT